MTKTKLGIFIGSLRKGSYSRKIAKALIARAPADWTSRIIEIGDLPLYNQDLDKKTPKAWTAFRDAVAECDALLFVTPEYNRSIPGVLKNATDIGSRPEGKNVFDGLPAAVVSTSPYASGGMAANHALRQSFIYLNLAIMQQPEAYVRGADELVDAKGKVTNKEADDQLRDFMSAFAAWTERLGQAQEPEPFEDFLKRREEISNAWIGGDGVPLKAISTEQDPATFFPPGGERIEGAASVAKATLAGAKSFAKGSTGHFEVLASDSGQDFAYWTGVQHANAMLKGKHEPVPMTLRTTEIFRNEAGAWKLIHRHADMIEEKEKS